MNPNRFRTTEHGTSTRELVSLVVLLAMSGLTLTSGCAQVPTTMLPGTTTLFFDGAEGAVSGDTDFTFEGASFSGGTVRTVADPSLYGSGRFAYEVRPGSTVTVDFDTPIDFLELVFILRGSGNTVLRALDAAGNEVGSINAGSARDAQTVELSGNAVSIEVTHTGDGDGWIDNFSFRPA